MRRSCDSFCVHKLQETTFVCNIAIDKFCLHYCILQLFFVQQLSTFLCIILIANVFYWLLQLRSIVWAHLRTFVCIIAIFDWQCSIDILYALLNLISCLHLWNLQLLYLLLFLWLVYTVYTTTIVKFLLCTMLSTFKMT